jgi:hypothetical protein
LDEELIDMSHQYFAAEAGKECCECGRNIEPGERYLHEKGFECDQDGEAAGEPWEFNTCLDCESIRDQFFTDWIYTQILNDLEGFLDEADGSVHEGCLARLTPRAREVVCSYIEACWRRIEEEENS